MTKLPINVQYLKEVLLQLLAIPSPTGYTDRIVHFVAEELARLGLSYELTRRGAIRASLPADAQPPGRAVVAHLDTLGAMVKRLKDNGRLEVVPVGTWSSRFAEGARVTVFTGSQRYRGTILPLKASGHIFDREIDTQPVSWTDVEIRLDLPARCFADLVKAGINVGDYVAVDPQPEVGEEGFINARHLDDKAGVACILAAARAVVEAREPITVPCYLLFTLSEEVGSGASAVLHGDIAEMVAVDNSIPGPGQNSTEMGITLCMMDMSGPFDYHLTHRLVDLCIEHGLDHCRDVFNHYRCDAASALEAGNDIRTALICFGLDSSHGYERTHIGSLEAVAQLLALYMQSPPIFRRDRVDLGSIKGFPTQPM